MKNILTLPSWLLVACLLTTALLAGCKPSAEQQARIEEQQREHALNTIAHGDVLPKVDTSKYYLFKRGGKYFIGPKEYGFFDGSAAFYWPSKTPHHAVVDDFPERAAAKLGNFQQVAIVFFVEASSTTGETYGFIEQAEKNGTLIRRSQLRPDLEKVETKSELQTGAIDLYFVATGQTTPEGKTATVFCRPTHACTSGFGWKPGYRIYVRFSSQHGEDWPKIYPEIIRILNLLKEA